MSFEIKMGSNKEFPPEARGWNWGAFCLTWIWGICNGTYIALLCLIPAVSFVMMFILGAKGNEWSWNNKDWASVEEFHRAQKRWAIAGLSLWAVFVTFVVVVPIGLLGWGVKTEWPQITEMFKDFGPHRKFCNYALQEAERNPRLTEQLGAPLLPNGPSETYAGKGYFETAIPVRGPKGEGTLYVRTREKNEELQLEKAEVELHSLERVPIETRQQQSEIRTVEERIVQLERAIHREVKWNNREPKGEPEGEIIFRKEMSDIQANPEIREYFGEHFTFKIENAFVKLYGPAGEASFVVLIYGNGHEGTLKLYASRSMGHWQFAEARVSTAGRAINIPLQVPQ